MSTTYTVTAVSDWRVTVLEDRGDGRTTTWELPLAWVDGPIVGEPLRGVVFQASAGRTSAELNSLRAAGVELAHAADQFIRKSDEWRPGCVRLQDAIQAAFAAFGMVQPGAAPQVAQPLTHSDEDRVEALLQRNHQHIAAMEAELAALKAQAAQPLTDEQIALAIRAPSRGSSLRRDGSTSFQIARAIERACAEKWGVKLAGQEGGAA